MLVGHELVLLSKLLLALLFLLGSDLGQLPRIVLLLPLHLVEVVVQVLLVVAVGAEIVIFLLCSDRSHEVENCDLVDFPNCLFEDDLESKASDLDRTELDAPELLNGVNISNEYLLEVPCPDEVADLRPIKLVFLHRVHKGPLALSDPIFQLLIVLSSIDE